MNFTQSRSDGHILSWRQNSTGQVMRNTRSEKKEKELKLYSGGSI